MRNKEYESHTLFLSGKVEFWELIYRIYIFLITLFKSQQLDPAPQYSELEDKIRELVNSNPVDIYHISNEDFMKFREVYVYIGMKNFKKELLRLLENNQYVRAQNFLKNYRHQAIKLLPERKLKLKSFFHKNQVDVDWVFILDRWLDDFFIQINAELYKSESERDKRIRYLSQIIRRRLSRFKSGLILGINLFKIGEIVNSKGEINFAPEEWTLLLAEVKVLQEYYLDRPNHSSYVDCPQLEVFIFPPELRN